VHARTLKVTGVGEGTVAEALEAAARARRDLSFGSYPFGAGTEGEIGTNLVIRGRDLTLLETAVAELEAALRAAGVPVTRT
jgi:molybdopterin-biosynthesis enzyme MoeA-like protein